MPKVTNLSGSAASFGQTTKDDTFPAANSVLDGGSSVASPLTSPTRYQSLRGNFVQSQTRQLNISDKMVANISKVYQSVQVDPIKYPSATEFARRIVVRKLQDIMIGTVRRLLRRGFEQWVNIRDLLKLQDVVKKCLCSFSCYKLHYAVEKSLDNQQYRLLHIWKQRMEWYRDGEQTAAAGELQRFWRGSLARKRLLNLEKSIAVVYIQKVVRGVQGRAFMLRHRIFKKRETAARRIESAYMKYRWRKIRKNIQVMKRQKRAVADIQRCYRGLVGRKPSTHDTTTEGGTTRFLEVPVPMETLHCHYGCR